MQRQGCLSHQAHLLLYILQSEGPFLRTSITSTVFNTNNSQEPGKCLVLHLGTENINSSDDATLLTLGDTCHLNKYPTSLNVVLPNSLSAFTHKPAKSMKSSCTQYHFYFSFQRFHVWFLDFSHELSPHDNNMHPIYSYNLCWAFAKFFFFQIQNNKSKLRYWYWLVNNM